MMILFILIYLVSFTLHLIICYKGLKHVRNKVKVGDLLDEIELYMWFPLINTIMILLIIIGVAVMKLWKLFKLDILWEKFRNIKLK